MRSCRPQGYDQQNYLGYQNTGLLVHTKKCVRVYVNVYQFDLRDFIALRAMPSNISWDIQDWGTLYKK